MLDWASALADGEPAHRTLALEDASVTSPTRRGFLWGGGAIAASLIAATVGWTLLSPGPTCIQTALGEIRKVPLSDKSITTMNTATTLEIDFRPTRRDVRLEAGEAWFEVAKDARRSFVVAAGDVRVRAVGTAFSVRRLAGGADVQVTEGRVEVWTVGRERHRLVAEAGARTLVTNLGGPQPAIVDTTGIDRTRIDYILQSDGGVPADHDAMLGSSPRQDIASDAITRLLECEGGIAAGEVALSAMTGPSS